MAVFVYLIGADGLAETKIGYSVDPKARLSGIRVGSTFQLRVMHTWRMSAAAAPAFEARLHRLFWPRRKQGEWFSVSPADIRSVGDALLAGDEERGSHLARSILLMGDLMDDIAALRRRRDECRPALDGPAIEDLTAEIAEATACYAGTWRDAVSFGLIPNEWDAVLA